jgi:hypothetical protein
MHSCLNIDQTEYKLQTKFVTLGCQTLGSGMLENCHSFLAKNTLDTLMHVPLISSNHSILLSKPGKTQTRQHITLRSWLDRLRFLGLVCSPSVHKRVQLCDPCQSNQVYISSK